MKKLTIILAIVVLLVCGFLEWQRHDDRRYQLELEAVKIQRMNEYEKLRDRYLTDQRLNQQLRQYGALTDEDRKASSELYMRLLDAAKAAGMPGPEAVRAEAGL
jgi:hypothetical protein